MLLRIGWLLLLIVVVLLRMIILLIHIRLLLWKGPWTSISLLTLLNVVVVIVIGWLGSLEMWIMPLIILLLAISDQTSDTMFININYISNLSF